MHSWSPRFVADWLKTPTNQLTNLRTSLANILWLLPRTIFSLGERQNVSQALASSYARLSDEGETILERWTSTSRGPVEESFASKLCRPTGQYQKRSEPFLVIRQSGTMKCTLNTEKKQNSEENVYIKQKMQTVENVYMKQQNAKLEKKVST